MLWIVYVGATTNGIASVKTMKTVEGIPDPPVTEPEVGNGNVVLALPAVVLAEEPETAAREAVQTVAPETAAAREAVQTVDPLTAETAKM